MAWLCRKPLCFRFVMLKLLLLWGILSPEGILTLRVASFKLATVITKATGLASRLLRTTDIYISSINRANLERPELPCLDGRRS